jgi:hypothetical protein
MEMTIRNIIKNIFHKKASGTADSILPRPKDWNLKFSDLVQEVKDGKRKYIGHPETTWAHEYDLSLMPSDYRFPQKGDLYESIFDQTIEFQTGWKAPFTGGGKSVLYIGERIWVSSESPFEKPLGVYALPVNYKELETRMVPSDERNDSKYIGFIISISTRTLNENFNLIQTGFSKEYLE